MKVAATRAGCLGEWVFASYHLVNLVWRQSLVGALRKQ